MAKYLKPDSELGYVEDAREIAYLKFNNLRHSVLGFMLGDFDAEGNYFVDEEIKKELINLKKYITESVENIDICVSEIKLDKQISFLVTFEGERATLSLVEKLSYEGNFRTDSGKYSNINEYILDEVETSGEVDKNILYKRWNISRDGGGLLDIQNLDEESLALLFGLVNRYKYLLKANSKLMEAEEEVEEIEAEYFLHVNSILKQYPKLNEVVQQHIKTALSENPEIIRIDKPYFSKTLNEVLDQAISDNLDLLNDKEKEQITAELGNAKLESVQHKEDVLDILENGLVVGEHKAPLLVVDEYDKNSIEELSNEFKDKRKARTQVLSDEASIAITGKFTKDDVAKVGILGKALMNLKDENGDQIYSPREQLLRDLIASGKDVSKNIGDDTKANVTARQTDKKADTTQKLTDDKKLAKPVEKKSGATKKPATKKKAAAKNKSAGGDKGKGKGKGKGDGGKTDAKSAEKPKSTTPKNYISLAFDRTVKRNQQPVEKPVEKPEEKRMTTGVDLAKFKLMEAQLNEEVQNQLQGVLNGSSNLESGQTSLRTPAEMSEQVQEQSPDLTT